MDEPTVQQRQQALVDLMKKNGSLKSPAVERAFLTVPRHLFLPGEPIERVYSDIAIAVRKVAENQWTSSSSQPTMMAIMLEQLDLHPGQKILEIGTGSGFNAALMAEIVGPEGRVVTVDIQPDLISEARERLNSLGYGNVQEVAGDGGYGYPEGGPYDRVILTVGSDVIAPAWRDQLVEGGRLVLPLSVGRTQKSITFIKHGSELVSAGISDCGFMMLQGAFAGSDFVRTQLGDDPGLYILSGVTLPADGAQIESWLAAPGEDLRSGVEVNQGEIWGGLPTWLALHQVEYGILFAEGEQAQRNEMPVVFFMGRGSDYRVKQSMILVEAQGAAAATRPPDRPAPYFDWDAPDDDEDRPPRSPFELIVRRIGPDPAPANRLLEVIRAWDAADRPGSGQMRVRAIPTEIEYQPAPGEFVMEKPWTRLIIAFSPRGGTRPSD